MWGRAVRLVGVEDIDDALPCAVDGLSVKREVGAALEPRLGGLGLDHEAIAPDLDLPCTQPFDAPRLEAHGGQAHGDAGAPVLLDRLSALDHSCDRCQ